MSVDSLAPSGLLTVDLGGTRLRVAAFDQSGAIVHKSALATPAEDPIALFREMERVVLDCGIPFMGAVVGVPGLVDYTTGAVLSLPNLPHWEGRIDGARLAAALGLPVLLANDADLAALGEHRHGAGQGAADLVCMTVGTGIGAGVILGDRLLHGRRSLAEVGHTIVDPSTLATLEALGSGTALTSLAGSNAVDVTNRARAGDARAAEFVAQVASTVAIGVLTLVCCFMPERVVIGGGFANAGALLLDPVRDLLRDTYGRHAVSDADVVLSEARDDIGLHGAYALGVDISAADWAGKRLRAVTPRGEPSEWVHAAHSPGTD